MPKATRIADEMMRIGMAGTAKSVANPPQIGTASKCNATNGSVPSVDANETASDPMTNRRIRSVKTERSFCVPEVGATSVKPSRMGATNAMPSIAAKLN